MKKETPQALIPANAQVSMKRAQEQIRGLNSSIQAVRASEITNESEYEEGSALLRKIATVKKAVEAERKSVTKLLDTAKKGIMGMFKPLIEQLDEARESIDERMTGWEMKKEALARKEEERERKKAEAQAKRLKTIADKKLAKAETLAQERAIKEQLKASWEAALAVGDAKASMVNTEGPQAEGISRRDVWDFEVENFDAVPHFWLRCEVNRTQILRAKREEETLEVPGLRFFQVRKRTVRGY